MYASSDEIPLSLVYGSEATVLPIENKVFKRRDVRIFNKRVKPGKMKVEDLVLKTSKEYGVRSKSKVQAKLKKIPIWLDKFYQGCCNGIRSKEGCVYRAHQFR